MTKTVRIYANVEGEGSLGKITVTTYSVHLVLLTDICRFTIVKHLIQLRNSLGGVCNLRSTLRRRTTHGNQSTHYWIFDACWCSEVAYVNDVPYPLEVVFQWICRDPNDFDVALHELRCSTT